MSAASQKRRPVEGTYKNNLQPSQDSTGHTTMLSHCTLLRNMWPNPTGVLEHCHEGETNRWVSIYRGVSLWPRPQGDKGCQCAFLYSQQQFLQIIPANSWNFSKLLHMTIQRTAREVLYTAEISYFTEVSFQSLPGGKIKYWKTSVVTTGPLAGLKPVLCT
jgi:hypothetical protein